MRDGAVGKCFQGVVGGLVVWLTEPEDAGSLDQGWIKVLVELKGLPRPASVDFFGAVAHADDPGFAAGGRASVGRAVLIDQDNAAAAKMKGAGEPCAENSGANHGEFIFR